MSALDIDPGASPAEPSSSIPSGLPIPTQLALQIASKIAIGQLTVTLPDGRSMVFAGKTPGPKAVLVVNDHRFATRILRDGDIGVAEGFLSGDWTSPDLPVFLELFCVNAEHTSAHLLAKPLFRALQNFQHWLRRNTKAGARRNIEAHYDLGNAFYEQWLDPSMTYSSALFVDETEELEEAQRTKYRALADAAGMREGEHVLEIGCGWGGFAEFAAKEVGARVTALTISPAQLDYARRRIFQAGLSERVTFKLQDYRDERGVFDRIASIEMFEAVGEKWWPAFFAQLRDRLRPGGAAGVQVITIQDRLFEAYRRETDFIQRYVFPGGMLPSPTALRTAATKAGLAVSDERIFGLDYAATLSKWRDRFRAAWPTIQPLGFDERFRRLWEYYLAYCEAGFRSGNIDVRQVVFARS
ncbi:class I SAM-dependent methyltransferase [Chelatococcus sambhunathii]|uniref:Class I SAM-dependent methyltransferase n=1 Tax=Chelatococcus sambhunathii TaxID=363953 RepID=A0ABU1DDC4_9HYPH|nr:cyclopropane-fatty-acyl-phospholipid synthase family protein [Chelatococcus sambhunathii]MDR4306106.1 class I SAM-dependent methyltransferase [Chelatococcus sambhunathii]